MNAIDPLGLYTCTESASEGGNKVKTCEGSANEMEDMRAELAKDGYINVDERSISEYGDISADIDNIVSKFDDVVKQMNDAGERYPGYPTSGRLSGDINNALSSSFRPNYKDCGEQALTLLDALNSNDFKSSLNSLWFNEFVYEARTLKKIFPHQNIQLRLDPHRNQTSLIFGSEF